MCDAENPYSLARIMVWNAGVASRDREPRCINLTWPERLAHANGDRVRFRVATGGPASKLRHSMSWILKVRRSRSQA